MNPKELAVPYRSVNPATGEVLKIFPEHTDQEMMDALATADKAFVSWGTRPVEERARIISRAAQLLLERKSALANDKRSSGQRTIAEPRHAVSA
jgi:succinate-semialdehyde dehydrogenase / glutarate-semialdehyde dehydrogenase